jgi:hypothetical protein
MTNIIPNINGLTPATSINDNDNYMIYDSTDTAKRVSQSLLASTIYASSSAINLSVEYGEAINELDPVAIIDEAGTPKAYKMFEDDIIEKDLSYNQEDADYDPNTSRLCRVFVVNAKLYLQMGEILDSNNVNWFESQCIGGSLSDSATTIYHLSPRCCYDKNTQKLMVFFGETDTGYTSRLRCIALTLAGGTTNKATTISSEIELVAINSSWNDFIDVDYDITNNCSAITYWDSATQYIKCAKITLSGGNPSISGTANIIANNSNSNTTSRLYYIQALGKFAFTYVQNSTGNGQLVCLDASTATITVGAAVTIDASGTTFETNPALAWDTINSRLLIVYSRSNDHASYYSLCSLSVNDFSVVKSSTALIAGVFFARQNSYYDTTCNRVFLRAVTRGAARTRLTILTINASTVTINFDYEEQNNNSGPLTKFKFLSDINKGLIISDAFSINLIDFKANGNYKKGLGYNQLSKKKSRTFTSYDSVNDAYVEVFTSDSVDGYKLYYMIGKYNTDRTLINWEDPVLVPGSIVTQSWISSAFDPVAGKVNIFYGDSSDSDKLKVIQATISGTTATFGSIATLSTSTCTSLIALYIPERLRIIIFAKNNSAYTKIFLIDPSDLSIKFSYISTNTNNTLYDSRSVKLIGNGQILNMWSASGNYYLSNIYISSNDSIEGIFGSVSSSITTGNIVHFEYIPNTNKIIIVYQNQTATDIVIKTIELNNKFLFSTNYTILPSNNRTIAGLFYSNTLNKLLLFTYTASVFPSYIQEIIINNSNLFLSEGKIFSLYTTQYMAMIEDGCKSIYFHNDYAYQLPTYLFNAIPATKYSGFVTETKALGETGIVRTFGELTGFTGLKKGQPVYIDKDGNKTHNLTSIKAGKASSATALVIQ